MASETLIQLLIERARNHPNRMALREKKYGIWIPTTWAELWQKSAAFGLFLRARGLKPGECVIVLGDNKPEWLIAEFGTLAAGGVISGIYPDSLPEEARYLIEATDARFVVASDQEQADKLLKIWEGISGRVQAIIAWDSRGMNHYYGQYPFLLPFQKCLEEGSPGTPIPCQDFVPSSPEQIAMMLTTSGTTAKPKLALLSNHNLLFLARSFGQVVPMDESDDILSLAPMAWIGEQLYDVVRFLDCGFRYNFPEEPETAQENIREIGPHVMFAPPRVYEQMVRNVQVKYLDASWSKRRAYELAMKIGYHVAELQFTKKPVPLHWKALNYLAYLGVHKKLKDHLGLSRIRDTYTGGAAMGPDHFRFFHALGVNLNHEDLPVPARGLRLLLKRLRLCPQSKRQLFDGPLRGRPQQEQGQHLCDRVERHLRRKSRGQVHHAHREAVGRQAKLLERPQDGSPGAVRRAPAIRPERERLVFVSGLCTGAGSVV